MNDVPADPVSPVDPAGPAEKEAKSSQNLAVLFADIDGSTKLYETHGDETAHRLTAQVLTQLDAQAGIAGGRTVKNSGYGVMCVFATPYAAFRAATLMRDAPQRKPSSTPAGFHSGPAIEYPADSSADPVNPPA